MGDVSHLTALHLLPRSTPLPYDCSLNHSWIPGMPPGQAVPAVAVPAMASPHPTPVWRHWAPDTHSHSQEPNWNPAHCSLHLAEAPSFVELSYLPSLPPLPQGLTGHCLAGRLGPSLAFIHNHSPGIVSRAWAANPRLASPGLPGLWVHGPPPIAPQACCSSHRPLQASREHILIGRTDVSPPTGP